MQQLPAMPEARRLQYKVGLVIFESQIETESVNLNAILLLFFCRVESLGLSF